GVFAGLDGDPRDVALAGKLVEIAFDRLALAAKAEGLAQVEPRRVVARIGEGALRLAVGETAGAGAERHAIALQQFGVVVELSPLPQPHAEEARQRPGLARLADAGQAVDAVVGRGDRRIALVDVDRLAVHLEAAWAAIVLVVLLLLVGPAKAV